MKLYLLLILVFSSFSWSQTEAVKHPRVLELEELFRDEASRYFERRFPNEAFFVRVDVTPLRRDSINNGSKGESLPYFDYESEEGIDEWDDVKTPLVFLRSRVSKVAIELSVPEKFSDERVASLRDELSIYLRLLPYRDDVKVERKIKDKSSFDVPAYAFVVIIGILMATLVGAFIIRSGLKKSGLSGTAQTSPSVPAAQAAQVSSPQVTKHSDKKSSSTAVSGDVTFHDPIKLLDVVHLKIEQIEKSETFPTLNDLMTLSELATRSSGKLSSLLAEFPQEWRKAIFPLGKGQEWLEAFCQNERIDFESLNILDKISRERGFSKKDRLWEDLIIQVWRGSDRLVPFFKKIPVDHAFLILESIPKTVSLSIAKKAFPGAWGRLLEKQGTEIALTPSILKDYIEQSRGFEPILEWSMLESYRKDREILDYLDRVTIDDEKDVYDTIAEDSFIIKVRPPFFQVFELEEEDWVLFVRKFPLEQWALSVVNSSRHFIKKIMDALDEKQKLVFSQHLRRFDSNLDLREQTRVRREIASTYSVQKTIAIVAPAIPELKGESDAQSA